MTSAARVAGAAEQAGQGTEAAARVADVLMLFASGPPTLGVSAVARELGLSKAVVHRILRTLADRMLISIDPASRGYRLGPATAALGARALRDSSLRAAGRPVIAALQRATGETTTLSSLVPGGRVYLDQVPSTQEIKMTVELGTRFPLHTGSSGKAILAFLPVPRQEELLSGELDRLTSRTITDTDHLRAELGRTRATGIANSYGERQVDAGSLAAPVFDVDGSVVGSISVCGPIFRFGDEARGRFAPACKDAADQVSRVLGWRGGLPQPGDTE